MTRTTTYALSEPLRAFIEQSQRFVAADESLEARRDAFLRACRYFTPPPPQGVEMENSQVDEIAIRVYRPGGVTPRGGWPTLLYLHGGGWDLGSLDSHDWFAFALLRRLPIAIVAVDYRLAPEHPFPAPLEDSLAVWQALRQGKVAIDLSSERLAVSGDSAGGTLAAGLCMALREQGGAQPILQALLYPVLTVETDLPSMQEHASAPMMTVAGLSKSIARFLPELAMRRNPCAMPLMAEYFDGLAPAFIGVAEYDPLRDHGYAYRDVLCRAGGVAELHLGEGLVHSSLRAFNVAGVELLFDKLATALRALMSDTDQHRGPGPY